ncbi:T9SS type A sorting domain-containing protein [Spirosoma spitsbergense]|uniref:T9SS type A sorting domain-containing protein n=1 Tax=Spirosoma spitsbergense TaxID=431554 RepID=UPI001FE1C60B|nr:T9SS type A sorting domain-containing protein [Spirosoma spitsbergense]
MNNTNTIRSLGWLLGLMLLFSWNLRAEGNPGRIDTGHLVQSSEFFKLLTPVDPPPISLTATVGVPFSFTLTRTLPIPPGSSTFTIGVTGLPDNGLSRRGFVPGFIAGTPLTSGVMNLTVIETSTASDPVNNATTWRAYTITVDPPRPPISLTATVGVPFSFTLTRTLPIPPGSSTFTIGVTGLPDNGLSRIGFVPGFIAGTPLTSGVMNLTVIETSTASNPVNNATTWQAYTITVDPPRPPISLTATVGVPFSATLPRTLPIPPGSSTYTIGVTGLPANGLSQMSIDPAFIVGTPLTSGVMNLTVVETFTASQPVNNATTWRAYTITVSPATPTAPFSITGVTTVSCATVTVGERMLTFTPQYTGVTGQPISFSVVNEMLPTTSPGPYTLRLYTDNPTITLKATQTGSPGEASFNYNWLAVCGGGSPPPPPTGTFSITGVTTVSCATVTAGERQLTFTPRYTSLNGQPVSFSVVNEMLPTTSPGPYTLRLYTDNPTITLKATQTGTPIEASFAYNWLAVCSGGGAPRLGVSLEPTAKLQVKLLGNPVREAVRVEVTGGENTTIHLSLTDMMGRIVGESRTERASADEYYRFDVSTLPAGTLLLRTSSQGQSETVRILKVN